MQIQTRVLIIGSLILLALGFGSGYFAKPTKIETRTVEVIKQQEAKQQDTNKVIYKEKIVYKDGTVKEVEKTQDSSSSKESSLIDSSKSSEKIVKNDVGLNLSLLAIVPTTSVQFTTGYGVHISKRVLSNVTVGVFADTDKKVGLSLGVSF